MSVAKGLHLHFDCVSGAAGDMTLGALFDLGVPVQVVDEVVAKLGLGADRLRVEPVVKSGISAIDVKVDTRDRTAGSRPSQAKPQDSHEEHSHGEHSHGEHSHGEHSHGEHSHGEHSHGEHRHYSDIKQLIRGAGLSGEVVARALDIFERVARAEAEIHGRTVDDVAFHEVGAIDSIVDIVGTAAALDYLAPASVSCAGVAMGHGTVHCAHGALPVPAPAALAIMVECGGIMLEGGPARELCTPTGAAILAHAVSRWGPMPELVPTEIGYGAGDIDLADRANVMRAVLGRTTQAAAEQVYRVEANVDDMSPELCEHAAQALFDAGAVDVWWSSISMKRGRPALLLSALAPEATLDRVLAATLRETTTIGVRFDVVSRRVLAREVVWVTTVHGRARVKLALQDGQVVNAAPEYVDCAQLARDSQVALKQIFAEVAAAYELGRASSD